MLNLLPASLIFIIWTMPTVLAAIPSVFITNTNPMVKLATIALVPMIFVMTFPLVAGALSLYARKGIKRGKFPREALHPIYLLRRIYGACWTQLYYFKPIYAVVLSIPFFKKAVFRLFGYKGACNFICYPDTWIRDLPILNIEEGAYLSNRATIGTNICLSDGSILVDRVAVGKKALIGHLVMLAPGCKISENAEIGVGSAIGIRVSVKEGALIKPTCSINHGTQIGAGADIGPHSFIGLRCEIGDKIKLPPGSNIPAGTIIKEQHEVEKYYSSETEKLHLHVDSISEIMKKHSSHAR